MLATLTIKWPAIPGEEEGVRKILLVRQGFVEVGQVHTKRHGKKPNLNIPLTELMFCCGLTNAMRLPEPSILNEKRNGPFKS
ncbi:hypothetical protein ACTRXD_06880 [Nitrospira sp. T9]